jgi:UDP-glucose 4-epimerase
MMKKKVLVTGGLGFIGSHIVDKLCEDGYQVAAIDIKQKPDVDYINPMARYFCFYDITNVRQMRYCFESFKPDYVIHCAALACIQPSFEAPSEYFRVNSEGTLNLLELSRDFGIKKFVYSASSSAYGNQANMPLKEIIKPRPLNPYALSKLEGEGRVKLYAKVFGVQGVSLRYFNVYGPRQSFEGRYGTVIGIFLEQAKNFKGFTIVSDGHQRRDFTWVGDVVQANILAMLSAKVGKGEVVNIGSAKNHSILEVAEMIGGKHAYKIFEEARPGEARESLADISMAKKLLNWEPKVSLEEGIKMLNS